MPSKSFDSRIAIRVLGVLALLVFLFVAADWLIPGSKAKKYGYDKKGRLTSLTTLNGRVIKYAYDNGGLLTGISYHKLGGITKLAYPAGDSVSYVYDAAGNRVSMKDRLGKTEYAYDDYNRPGQVTDANGKKLIYEYDPWNQIKRIVFPDGYKLQYRHDLAGNITRIGDGQGVVSYEQNADSNQVIRKLPNGISTVYQYSALGQLISIRHLRPDNQPLCTYNYEYDPEGRISKLVETTEQGTETTSYEYDLLGRVSKATQPDNTTVTYQYDSMGNRTSESNSSGTTHYQYDAQGRLVQAGETKFAYDNAGNLVSRKNGGQITSYQYDDENRLLEVTSGKNKIRYSYDGDGNRVRREINGRVTNYLTETVMGIPQVISEYGRDGRMSNYLLGQSRIGRRNSNGETIFFLEDHLGSTRYVIDASGKVLSRFSYSLFGVPKLIEGKPESESSYTGESWDPETNLLYLRARYYDPQLGRFLSGDPLPGSPLAPESFNQYVYVSNDPVNQIDPSGLQGWPPPPFRNPSYELLKYNLPRTGLENLYQMKSPPVKHGPIYDFSKDVWDITRHGELFHATHERDLYFRALLKLHPVSSLILFTNDALYDASHDRKGTALLNLSRKGLQEELGARNPLLGAGVGRVVTAVGVFNELAQTKLVQNAVSDLSEWNARWKKDTSNSHWTIVLPPNDLDQRRNFFLPPPGGGDGGTPRVGGVYLDQAAKVIGQLGVITGATYDPTSGRLTLIGEKNTTLPPIKPEYLAEAIRVVYSDRQHEPGMTIDPNPKDPHGPFMNVIFFGNTENTHLGSVMFEADRVMKGYSVGSDNITRKPIVSSIPGYQNTAAIDLRNGNPNTGLWSRFWLVPEPLNARTSDDGRTIMFDPIKMRVKTETMKWDGSKLVSAGGVKDPAAEIFAAHFTTQYDDFARENSIYAELKQVAQAVALAKWMKQQNIPVDWGFVRLYAGEPYTTPTTTPSATSEISGNVSDGVAFRTRTIKTIGGVEMVPQIQSQKATEVDSFHGELTGASTSAQQQGEISFRFKFNKKDFEGVSLPGFNEREVASYDLTESEADDCLKVPAEMAQLPGLTRYYNSSHNEPTEFGFSWSLLLPRLEIETPEENGHTRYLSVESNSSTPVLVQKFLLTNQFGVGEERFNHGLVDQALNRVVFKAESGNEKYRGLYPESDGNYRVILNSGEQALFDPKGTLRAIDKTNQQILYEYDSANHLIAIRLKDADHEDVVTFKVDVKGRLVSASSGNSSVNYEYDGSGNLGAAKCGGRASGYRYNDMRLLVEVSLNGRVISENSYDDFGRLLKQKDETGTQREQKVEATAGGKVITIKDGAEFVKKLYDAHHRLIAMEDSDGGKSEYSYDEAGRLSRIEQRLTNGGKSKVEISDDRKTVTVQDPRGIRNGYRFNDRNQIAEITINDKRVAFYRYEDQGRLAAVSYESGDSEAFTYDGEGRVVEYRRMETEDGNQDPSAMVSFSYDEQGGVTGISNAVTGQVSFAKQSDGATVMRGRSLSRYQYDGERLARIDGPEGSVVSYSYRADGSLGSVDLIRAGSHRRLELTANSVINTNQHGAQTIHNYGSGGLLESVQDSYGVQTSYSYDDKNRLHRVELPNGRCLDYLYDSASGRLREERSTVCRK